MVSGFQEWQKLRYAKVTIRFKIHPCELFLSFFSKWGHCKQSLVLLYIVVVSLRRPFKLVAGEIAKKL